MCTGASRTCSGAAAPKAKADHVPDPGLKTTSAEEKKKASSSENAVSHNVETVDFEDGVYQGGLEYGLRHGLGCYLWHNGNFYNGHWKDDNMEGAGTLYYARGGVLKGNFAAGKLSGFGRCSYPNGDCYVGIWNAGKYHGRGLFYKKEGNCWVLGVFDQGSLKQEQGNGSGKPRSLSIPEC